MHGAKEITTRDGVTFDRGFINRLSHTACSWGGGGSDMEEDNLPVQN
jgi:hypothetical protein